MLTPITKEWVESLGTDKPFMGAFSKKLSDGPGDSEVRISIGQTAWNGHGVMIYIGDYGVLTNAECQEDVIELIRLLKGGRIDHPYEEDI